MSPEAAFAGLACLIAVVGPFISWMKADASARVRSDLVGARVAKIEGLLDRVTTLEANEKNGAAALEKHYRDDMAALARISSDIDRMRTELLGSMSEVRSDIRARLGHEDTNPRR